MKPTLLILAAGMGSRYGGLKQLEPVGPGGATLMDYSVYDALRAGFGRLVFVIRQDFEDVFRQTVGRRYEDRVAVDYVFQRLDDLPEGFTVPDGRAKPWGTGHAVLTARDRIQDPFAVINADDFYGASSFRLLADFLGTERREEVPTHALVAYRLRSTLSEFGSVSRGLCECDERDYLRRVVEIKNIEREGAEARYEDEDGLARRLDGAEWVSMNLLGFDPRVFERLSAWFAEFMTTHRHSLAAEFYLPTAVNALVESGEARVKVLFSSDAWCGVTHREDYPAACEKIGKMVRDGLYPEKLWAD